VIALDNRLLQIGTQVKTSQQLQKVILLGSCIILSLIGISYWVYNKRFIATDDAYVNANVVQIAPQISGRVNHLYVENNQFVKKGQLLFQIDPATFQTAVLKAQAQLAMDQARWQGSRMTAMRTLPLVAKKDLSAQMGDNTTADLQSSTAAVDLAKANLAEAELELSYTRVYAPANGWITNMTLQEGDIVTPDQPLFALVNSTQYWIDANFKETQLQNIHTGQFAQIIVDMYPKHIFQGYVASISSSSGTAFSLLPPQNATGNWVKISQRVPIKVVIINPDDRYPLRIGTTARVKINMRAIANNDANINHP
jgi:membrane fusion protein, multidrug efflux system